MCSAISRNGHIYGRLSTEAGQTQEDVLMGSKPNTENRQQPIRPPLVIFKWSSKSYFMINHQKNKCRNPIHDTRVLKIKTYAEIKRHFTKRLTIFTALRCATLSFKVNLYILYKSHNNKTEKNC